MPYFRDDRKVTSRSAGAFPITVEHLDSALRNRYRNRVLQVTKRIYCRHQGSNLRLRGNIAITTDCVRCELDSGLEEGNFLPEDVGNRTPRPFSVTPLREDTDFNVPRKVGIAVGTPAVSAG